MSEDEEDEYGPKIQNTSMERSHRMSRPSAPGFSELALRAEQETEDVEARRNDLQIERKTHRAIQKERLEELLPRAEPGTRDRQLEKKAEKAATVRAFKDAKGDAGDMQEVGDKDLLGDEGGVGDVKRMKNEMERKRSEREQRKLEILQARSAEREERLAAHREKEDKTMEMLRAIAKERFG